MQLPRNPTRKPRSANKKTPTPALLSPAKNLLKLAAQARSAVFYMINAVVLWTVAKVYVQWSTSTNRKRRKKFSTYGKNNRELKALNETKFQKFVKNKKRWKTKQELQHFQEMQIFNDKSKKVVSSLIESVESGKFYPLVLNKIKAWTNYLLHV